MAQSINGKIVLPGDKLASIEEFVPGGGIVVEGDSLVASTVGQTKADMKNRVITVKPAITHPGLPKVGDLVEGVVQSAQSSIAQIRIDAINGVRSPKEFTGMLSMRDDRRRRTSSPIKPGDAIRAEVTSTTNAIFHLSLEGRNTGVLFTVCSNCGGNVVALGPDRVKCRECGLVDERILSEEFVKFSRSQPTS